MVRQATDSQIQLQQQLQQQQQRLRNRQNLGATLSINSLQISRNNSIFSVFGGKLYKNKDQNYLHYPALPDFLDRTQ